MTLTIVTYSRIVQIITTGLYVELETKLRHHCDEDDSDALLSVQG